MNQDLNLEIKNINEDLDLIKNKKQEEIEKNKNDNNSNYYENYKLTKNEIESQNTIIQKLNEELKNLNIEENNLNEEISDVTNLNKEFEKTIKQKLTSKKEISYKKIRDKEDLMRTIKKQIRDLEN